MGYIERLSKEDIEILVKMFLEIPSEIVSIKRLPGSNKTQAAYIDFDDNSNLVINDYSLSSTNNLIHSPDWKENFVIYMTHTFGTNYLNNYANLALNIPYYKAEVEDALQNLETKQKECTTLINYLKDCYNNFDFTAIFGGPMKL